MVLTTVVTVERSVEGLTVEGLTVFELTGKPEKATVVGKKLEVTGRPDWFGGKAIVGE
jgi:hypothetical protein